MLLKTKADRDYLIRLYHLARPGDAFDCKQVTRTAEDLKSFTRLRRYKYISNESSSCFRLTRLGLEAAQEAEELRDQCSEAAEEENKKQLLATKRELCIALISAAFGSLLTLIVEHLIPLLFAK